MPIVSIGGVGGALPKLPTLPTTPGAGSGAGGDAVSGAGFATKIGGALENLQATQAAADQLATQAATGTLTDVHDYLIASTQAGLATELTVAVRNKAVEAFQSVMNMPV
jgi:flagellar hook-basal body complex protein FliE